MLDNTAAGLDIVKIQLYFSADKRTPYYAFQFWNVMS